MTRDRLERVLFESHFQESLLAMEKTQGDCKAHRFERNVRARDFRRTWRKEVPTFGSFRRFS